jgi:hypothetical protein
VNVLALCGLRGFGGRVIASNVCNREDWSPNVWRIGWESLVSKSSGDESALSPAVVDGRKVPFDNIGCGPLVELVANVNEVLDRSDVNVVD